MIYLSFLKNNPITKKREQNMETRTLSNNDFLNCIEKKHDKSVKLSELFDFLSISYDCDNYLFTYIENTLVYLNDMRDNIYFYVNNETISLIAENEIKTIDPDRFFETITDFNNLDEKTGRLLSDIDYFYDQYSDVVDIFDILLNNKIENLDTEENIYKAKYQALYDIHFKLILIEISDFREEIKKNFMRFSSKEIDTFFE